MISLNIVPIATAKCEGCGETFQKKSHNQRRCSISCGRMRRPRAVSFNCVDGEGLGSDPSIYVLFGVGNRQIENSNGLDWKDCFQHLYGQYESSPKGTAFVGFYLGYDFTQILKSLPEDRARMLLTKEGRAKRQHRVKGKEPHPVEYQGWQFDILGSKRLRIRPKLCNCTFATCGCKKASWCYLCDAGGFWQTSFLNVINPKGWKTPIVTEDEYNLILEGKNKRGIAELDDDMRFYNKEENRILAKAMTALNEGFESIGIHLTAKQFFGPGQASSNWLRSCNYKKDDVLAAVPEWYMDAARQSYYGGWFETFCHGYIKGEVHEYDINSAYPSIIRTLPCLLHGKYTRGMGRSNGSDYTLTRARVKIPGFSKHSQHVHDGRRIGTMLHRNSDGSIYRPAITEGWFWRTELEAATRAGFIDRKSIEYLEWVDYEPCDCLPPFRGIEDLYLTRLAVGKSTPLGKGAKLAYNSAYGKFAQSVGNPQFGNAIYASKTTSGCREQICDAISTHPDKDKAVAMVATDAVFFLKPHPGLTVSENLGEWDYTLRHNLTIFKPGVYWDDETRRQIREQQKPKFKARGINATKFAEEIWKVDFQFKQWIPGQKNEWPNVEFTPEFAMITATQALARGKWHLAGTNDPKPVTHDSNPYRKRGMVQWDNEWQVWRSAILCPPFSYDRGDYDCVSKPYEKRFGIDDPYSDETREAYGITEDGTISQSYNFLFRNDE